MILTRYITADEFREYIGINLEEELRDTSNPSDKVNAFLKRIEDRMEVYLNAHFFKNVSELYPCFTDNQKYHYKLALIEQAYYVFKNGDISTDSGYDPERGIVASKHARTEITLAPNAVDHLRMTGLWSGFIGGGSFFGPFII
jgi:hypothetical protein